MNFEKYKNKLSYPKKPAKPGIPVSDDPTVFRDYANALETYKVELEKYNLAKDAYYIEDAALYEKFRKDAINAVGLDSYANKQMVDRAFGYAWDQGHANGYSEVFNALSNISQIILGY